MLVLHVDDDHDCGDENQLRDIVDAQVEPDPATVVGGEVESLLIADVTSSLLVLLCVSEGADNAVSSQSLVHVGFHWAEDGMADSVELVVDCEVWSHHIVAAANKDEEEGKEVVGDAEEKVE